MTPHEPTEYQIEIPAFGHVFRPGHKLALIIMQPVEGDPIGVTRSGAPSDRYDSHPPPGTVTILYDAAHSSSLRAGARPDHTFRPARAHRSAGGHTVGGRAAYDSVG